METTSPENGKADGMVLRPTVAWPRLPLDVPFVGRGVQVYVVDVLVAQAALPPEPLLEGKGWPTHTRVVTDGLPYFVHSHFGSHAHIHLR